MRAIITVLDICGNCAQARFLGLLHATPNTLRIICTSSRLIPTPKCNNTRPVNTFTTENEPSASHAFSLLTNTGRLVFFLCKEKERCRLPPGLRGKVEKSNLLQQLSGAPCTSSIAQSGERLRILTATKPLSSSDKEKPAAAIPDS